MSRLRDCVISYQSLQNSTSTAPTYGYGRPRRSSIHPSIHPQRLRPATQRHVEPETPVYSRITFHLLLSKPANQHTLLICSQYPQRQTSAISRYVQSEKIVYFDIYLFKASEAAYEPQFFLF